MKISIITASYNSEKTINDTINSVLSITYNNISAYQEFLSPVGKWYEVPALAEDTVFIPDPGKTTDQSNIKVGKYIRTSNKFITEFTPEGFLKITFGGGSQSADEQLREFARDGYQLNLYKYSPM